MIETPQHLRALTHDLAVSTWTLAALGVLFESGLVDLLREPRSLDELATRCPALSRGRIERALGVVVAAGGVVVEDARYRLAEGMLPFLQPPMRAAIEGDIRTHLMQPLAFLDDAKRAPGIGWTHTDPAILQAQGNASSGMAPMFKMMIAPALGDLASRLERPGARFLDVGVGVAALSIAMCRAWPALHVTGLDVSDVPLAVARDNVANAKLGDRIELRRLAVEDLRDAATFDLAWLPSFFISPAKLTEAIHAVAAALRPGGWLLFCLFGGGDDRQRANAALLTELWGGPVLATADVEAALAAHGLTAVRTVPGPAFAPVLVVGQRSP